jgi:DNA-binding NtrC family response regulator
MMAQKSKATKYEQAVVEFERTLITGVLYKNNWDKNATRKELNIPVSTLYRIIKTYGLADRPKHVPEKAINLAKNKKALLSLEKAREAFEYNFFADVLQRHNWDKIKACEEIGLSTSSFYRIIQKHNLSYPPDELLDSTKKANNKKGQLPVNGKPFLTFKDAMFEAERAILLQALVRARWNKLEARALLKLSANKFVILIKRHKLQKPTAIFTNGAKGNRTRKNQ